MGDATRPAGDRAKESAASFPNSTHGRTGSPNGLGTWEARQPPRSARHHGTGSVIKARVLTILDPDEEQLARMLVLMWSVISGRSLDPEVPLDQLSVDELISFWADDLAPVAGRHARAGIAPSAEAGS